MAAMGHSIATRQLLKSHLGKLHDLAQRTLNCKMRRKRRKADVSRTLTQIGLIERPEKADQNYIEQGIQL